MVIPPTETNVKDSYSEYWNDATLAGVISEAFPKFAERYEVRNPYIGAADRVEIW